MSWLRRLVLWIRALVARSSVENELAREMRFHLEMEVEKNLRDGMNPDEARRRALVAFGGTQRFREEVNDERGTRPLADVLTDLRYGIRTLRKNPGFSLVAVLTLAVGIGATTAVFSLANWVLFRPVPGVVRPDELVVVRGEKSLGQSIGISYLNFLDLREATPAFAGFMGHSWTGVQMSGEGIAARSLEGETVVGDYFGVLGVTPFRGRFFRSDELEPPSEARVAVISHELWRSLFGSANDALGRTIRLNATEFTIIGIAPEDFRGTDRVREVDLWLPGPTYGLLRHSPGMVMTNRKTRLFQEYIGRVRPGATGELAQQQLRRAMDGLIDLHPDATKIYTEYPLTVHPGIGMAVHVRPVLGPTIRLLFGAVALVMLIACANAANLLLFRGMRRRGEFAVRRALGASSGRLLRQHLVEGLVLSTAGGIAGVGLAVALVHWFDGQVLPNFPPIADVPIDTRVLGFAVALSLATGLLAGIIPAVSAARQDHLANLKEASRSMVGGSRRLRTALTTIQIAASMALGVGAVLLVRTLLNLHRVDLGFEPSGVLSIWINPDPQGYPASRLRTLRYHLIDRVATQPGVDAVALSSSLPLAFGYHLADLRSDDDQGTDWPVRASIFAVSPGYFQTLRMQPYSGRNFTEGEFRADSASAPAGVVISRETARRLFGDGDPTGRQLVERGFGGTTTSRPILGVVGDVMSMGVRGEPTPVIYESLSYTTDGPTPMAMLLVRSGRPAADIEAMVRSALDEFDRSLPISRVEPMVDRVAANLAQERLFARIVGLLAGIACLLAAVGLYSLISYSVEQRRREIGVRMALGAQTAAIVGLIVRQAGVLVAAGLVVGTVAAVVLARVLESRLFGVASLDITAYAAAAAVLIGLGIIASAVPARSASRVNPVETLRQE